MPQVINISDEDIRYAENILLPTGKFFDDERRDFIRNLNTIDLQAVPGSGKTTALLAKLIILERKLPFIDGSSILVLSHTNAAIEEIKSKIQKHCPQLFTFPNYIGTIQRFVNEFLAIPYYIRLYEKKPNRIDNEIYNEVASKRFHSLPNSKAKAWLTKQRNPEGLLKNFRFDIDLNLKDGINGSIILKSDNDSPTYKTFKTIKLQILESGILNFDDAYFLAELYLQEIPSLKDILQKRFSFVFVDEMQDMDIHQYNLLENIFYNDGNVTSIFQRIGDKNQSIYNSIKATEVWNDRSEILRLNGSQRLSQPIANVVKKFALHTDAKFDIVGLHQSSIKPHILVFDDVSIKNIIPCYVQIVRDHGLEGLDKSIKVVCWNTDWKDDEVNRQDPKKLRLEDYYIGFKKEKNKPRQDYDSFKSYIFYYDKTDNTLNSLYKNILNGFLKILRLENINTTDNRPYTRKKLLDFIKETDIQKYEKLSLKLYNWSIGVIQGDVNSVWNQIKAYVPIFLETFSRAITPASFNFINNGIDAQDEETEQNHYTNHLIDGEFEIEITSIHSVKGQTHSATLYLESWYQGKHESERLANQFLGTHFNDSKVHHKSSVKMVYVGFSRPTDLLCVAIHKDRFDKYLSGINREEWEIKEVTS